MRNPLFKKADRFHPEEGFYRGKKFQKAPKEPEPKFKDGATVLVDGKKGRIQTSYNGAMEEGEPTFWLYAIRWPDGTLSHRGYREDEIELVPDFTEDDQKFLKDFRISGNLRKRIQAAYMNGYAEHASKWIREHGNVTRGSDDYAERNGLRPEYFKEAIYTMRRYARAKKAYTLTNEGMGAATCPKCNQPIKENEMINWTAQGQEAHISCPVQQVGDTAVGTPAKVTQTPETTVPQAEIPTQSYYASKQAAQYIDDEWREVLVSNGWYPHSIYVDGKEIEQWRKQGMKYSVVIAVDVNTQEPFYGIYNEHGKFVDGGTDTYNLEIYTTDKVVEKTPEAKEEPRPFGEGEVPEFSDEDKTRMRGLGIKASLLQKIALNIPRLVKDFGPKLVAQYAKYKNLTPERAAMVKPEDIIEMLKSNDPTPNFEYTAWLTGNFARGEISPNESMRPLLERYHALKKNRNLEQQEADINKIRGYEPLKAIIDKYADVDTTSKRKQQQSKEQQLLTSGAAEVFYNDGQFKIIIPHTQEAACFFGINTKWCTAATEGTNHFQNYDSDGPLYIVLIKAANERYQFHFQSAQFMDEEDHEIKPYYFFNMYPKLAVIFYPIAEETRHGDGADCDDCSGTGEMRCGACDGDGTREVECSYCEGAGQESCDECNGEGRKSCDDCGGDGTVTVEDDQGNEMSEDCSTCDGSGTVSCDDCSGEGFVECTYCNGRGEISDECGHREGAGREKCDSCEGSGKSPDFMEFYNTLRTFYNKEKQPKALAQHASKNAALEFPEHTFSVPNESAPHVAHHLANAGMLDFEVEPDDRLDETFFIFKNNDDLEVAHEIVRHNFKRQIDAGKGQWALWKELEPADNLERKPERAMASKQAGAWGVGSYDNDYVHDILDKYRMKGKNSKGFDEAVPAKSVQPLLDDMLTMVDNAHTPEDQARFFGVMVFLTKHGVKLDPTFKHLAIEIGRELSHNDEYLNMWDDPTARKLAIKQELKLFGQPLSFAAAKEEESQFHDINDPVCICTHTFHDHERGCDHCECPGFDPAPMRKQVEYVCEHRAFGRVGKGSNPMVFERSKNERILKVYLDGDRVEKAEFYGRKGDKPETRQGWDGFFSFTQTFGD